MRMFNQLGARVWAGITMACLAAAAGWGQTTWQTTHTSNGGFNSGPCELSRAQLRVKVHPAYLEVEEELEIGTMGQVSQGNDPATLEIVGNFRLPSGSAITGSLLWDGNRILEGKLLDRKLADSLYEKMVERNSNPPLRPRDPLIIELTGKDTYRLRIYPVKLGGSRRFRLRYQLPPRIGAEGLQMTLQAAVGTLFPGLANTLPVTLEGAGGVESAVLAEGSGRNTLRLPRTRFMRVADLAPFWNHWNSWDNREPALRILPVDPLHQVMVKTSFAGGSFAGHYINLYAGVTEDLVRALGQRVEVAVLWKWHNPGSWIRKMSYGEEVTGYVWQAQEQAANIMQLHGMLGAPGIKVGLLHDDSKSAPRAFPMAAQGDSAYRLAAEYLQSLQGSYVEDFVRALRITAGGKPDVAAAVTASKGRFLSNMRLVKTLYSPETGVVRHLIMVSAGPDHVVENTDLNDSLSALFDGLPISVAGFTGGFSQAGFDLWEARRNHAYRGPTASTPWGEVPGLPPMNLNVVVRNTHKAYDFTLQCQGGLGLSCGSLTFHGKSDQAWADTLEWEAFDPSGKLLGRAKTSPKVLGAPGDTGVATLWAGSESPFSEKKELPLGPVYGFVDRWASMLALEKDTVGGERAKVYADTGVPRIANKALKDVIPNYENGQGPGGPIATGVADGAAKLSDPATWRLERSGEGLLRLRIPGLRPGARVVVEAYDLHGRKLGLWNLASTEGMLLWKADGLKPGGVYLLKIKVDGLMGTKRIAL